MQEQIDHSRGGGERPIRGQDLPRPASVSLEKAADLLNVGRRSIYNYIHDGRLLTIRTAGGSQRVTDASLQLFVANRVRA